MASPADELPPLPNPECIETGECVPAGAPGVMPADELPPLPDPECIETGECVPAGAPGVAPVRP